MPAMVRFYSSDMREAHRLAMRAKQLIFRSQDAATRADAALASNRRVRQSRMRDKAASILARVRMQLEQLDRLMLEAQCRDNERCTCGAFGADGAPDHSADCSHSDGFWDGDWALRPWGLPEDERIGR